MALLSAPPAMGGFVTEIIGKCLRQPVGRALQPGLLPHSPMPYRPLRDGLPRVSIIRNIPPRSS